MVIVDVITFAAVAVSAVDVAAVTQKSPRNY